MKVRTIYISLTFFLGLLSLRFFPVSPKDESELDSGGDGEVRSRSLTDSSSSCHTIFAAYWETDAISDASFATTEATTGSNFGAVAI